MDLRKFFLPFFAAFRTLGQWGAPADVAISEMRWVLSLREMRSRPCTTSLMFVERRGFGRTG